MTQEGAVNEAAEIDTHERATTTDGPEENVYFVRPCVQDVVPPDSV